MNSKGIWILIIVIILVAGAFLLWQGSADTAMSTPTPTSTPTTPTPTPPAPSPTPTSSAAMSASISYDGSKFTPSEVTIKKGGTVTWSSSVASMEVASAPHPSHTGYNGTVRAQHCAAGATPSFDQCKGGKTYSFKFDKVGTWPYHDHENASAFGRVIVVE